MRGAFAFDDARLAELDSPGGDFCAVIIQERAQGRILGAAFVDMRAG